MNVRVCGKAVGSSWPFGVLSDCTGTIEWYFQAASESRLFWVPLLQKEQPPVPVLISPSAGRQAAASPLTLKVILPRCLSQEQA